MIDSFYIAWKYISYYRIRSIILVACITLIAVLPLTLEFILKEAEKQLVARAESTPLLVGAKGSALDLVMNSLYFSHEAPENISMRALDEVMDSDLAAPIPLYVRFKARGFPVVGTSLDYLAFRGLQLADGRSFAIPGEAVIGAAVAEKLAIKAGDTLVTSPETLFDLAGVYPLKMKITGVLAPSHSPDDHAVFVDVMTAWIIEGLGHGHEDLAKTKDESVIIKRDEGKVVANAKLMQYREITQDNMDSFHLHGEPSQSPLTAVLALPHDARSGTILQGRYLASDSGYQIVRPLEIVDTLLETIFRIRNVLDAVILLVALSTLMALILVFSLSLRLRQKEINTIFRLGCSRLTIARLLGAEILVILFISALLSSAFLFLVAHYDQAMVRAVLM